MTVLNEPPHPQVMFAGFGSDGHELDAMRRMVPSSRVLDEATAPDTVRVSEWDVMVVKSLPVSAPGHMHVLAMGCESLGLADMGAGRSSLLRFSGQQHSGILSVSDHLTPALRRLITTELVPALNALAWRPYLERSEGYGAVPFTHVAAPAPRVIGPSSRRIQAPTLPGAVYDTWIADPDGNFIAGAFQRSGGGWCWAIPVVPANPQLWLAAAMSDWSQRTPDRVPPEPTWQKRAQWLTAREKRVQQSLSALRVRRDSLLEAIAREESDMLAEQRDANIAAESGPRRLITSQGPTLVDAVIDALRSLGFVVVDADKELAEGEPKLEDLRLTDPEVTEWQCMAEVKGYAGGAKTRDLQQIARFVAMGLERGRRRPDSQWYIVNQFLGEDPDGRSVPLSGAGEDVLLFARDGGLVVDTRDLFVMAQSVEDGAISRSEARALLRGATGVFAWAQAD